MQDSWLTEKSISYKSNWSWAKRGAEFDKNASYETFADTWCYEL